MIPLWLRFAARELRSGVKGFRIFLACLALGVAAIAAASSTAEAFRRGLATEAREILGGDLEPSAGSVARSGWGIRPRTFPCLLMIPAILLSEPFGLASGVTSPEGVQ